MFLTQVDEVFIFSSYIFVSSSFFQIFKGLAFFALSLVIAFMFSNNQHF